MPIYRFVAVWQAISHIGMHIVRTYLSLYIYIYIDIYVYLYIFSFPFQLTLRWALGSTFKITSMH